VIALLRGRIAALGADHAVIDVGGVGYLVHASARTLHRLGPIGTTAELLVDTVVREDAILLYGFAEESERVWFRLLQTVQGVGARVALAILGVLEPAQLQLAVAAQDRATLTRASGVGAKLATRILAELKDRSLELAAQPPGPAVAAAGPAEADGDAVSALVNLGYGRSEAFGVVSAARARLGAAAGLDALLRDALKELAR
jgi:Holliday junction DNA helicase RuvA